MTIRKPRDPVHVAKMADKAAVRASRVLPMAGRFSGNYATSRDELTELRRLQRVASYLPHQGAREIARRLAKAA